MTVEHGTSQPSHVPHRSFGVPWLRGLWSLLLVGLGLCLASASSVVAADEPQTEKTVSEQAPGKGDPAPAPGMVSQAPIRVVIDDNYPPYSFRGEDGKLQGILIDLWKLWEEKNGTPVQITGMDWLSALEHMRQRDFEVIDTIFVTEERAKIFLFSPAYLHIDVPIFFRKDLQGIQGVASLKDFRVGVKGGDAAIERLRAAGVEKLEIFPNYENVIQAARDRKIDLFVVDKPAAQYFLHKYDLAEDFRESETVQSGEFHRAYAKDHAGRMDLIEAGFQKISPEEFTLIQERWEGFRLPPVGRSMHYLIYITCTVLVIALGLIIWIQMLRWQLSRHARELASSDQQFADMVAFIPLPLIVTKGSHEVLLINRPFTEALGYTLEDIPTLDDWLIKAYPDPSYRSEILNRRRLEIGQAGEREESTPVRSARVTDKHGRIHEMELRSRTLKGGVLTVLVDTTDRNRMLVALQQSENRYRRLHESLHDAYGRVDGEGRIIDSNRAFRELVGYTEEELAKLTYKQLTPPKWHAMETAILQSQVLSRGFSDLYEKEYLCKDGSIKPVELQTFAIRDEQGKPQHMWAIVRDLESKKRQIEDSFQFQKQEAISQLASGVAHDFNDILSSMMLNIGLLQSDASLDGQLARPLSALLNDVQRASSLTGQLMTFAGRQPPQLTRVDIAALLSRLLPKLRAQLGERHSLHYIGNTPIPSFGADAGMIEHSLTHLCLNAREASPEGGRIVITTSILTADATLLKTHPGCEPGAYLRLSIQDEGPGVDPKLRHRVFDPFFSTKQSGKSSGLGLSVIYGIARQHGGWIEIAPGAKRGAHFQLFVPMRPAPVQTGAWTESPQLVAGTLSQRILLVEDEDNIRNILTLGLTRLGYSVTSTANAQEALGAWKQGSGDFVLVISDIMMPGEMNGLSLAKELHALAPKLHIILSSGYNNDYLKEAEALGFPVTTLHKPYSLSLLSQVVHRVLST